MNIFEPTEKIEDSIGIGKKASSLDTSVDLIRSEDSAVVPPDSPLADPAFIRALAATHRKRMLARVGLGPQLQGSEPLLLDEIGEDVIVSIIATGVSPLELSNRLRIKVSELNQWVRQDNGRAERVNEAIEESGWAYAAKAGKVLDTVDAQGLHAKNELSKAKALSSYYRWMSASMNRKRFGQINNQKIGEAAGTQANITIVLNSEPEQRAAIDVVSEPANRQTKMNRALFTG